jgi:hypothetical protein
MTRETESLDDAILHAAESVCDEDETVEGPLSNLLAQARGTPEERRQAANLALDLLIRHPDAWEKLREQLRAQDLASEEIAARFFEPLPGAEAEVPAGTLMVCPQDPTHYRKRLHQKGQVMFCPQHGVRLVPLRDEEARNSERHAEQ